MMCKKKCIGFWQLLRRKLRSRGNHYDIRGKRNIFKVQKAVLKKCRFFVMGNDNVIIMQAGVIAKHMTFHIHGSGNTIFIGEDCYLGEGSELHIEDDSARIEIGRKTTLGAALLAVTEPNAQLIIGEDCMIAHDVEIRTGDSHSILDIETGERINFAKNVCLKNHVWVGAHAKILKGVTIEEHAVVALAAVVSKNVSSHTVVAGNPAKCVKSGITWSRERVYR